MSIIPLWIIKIKKQNTSDTYNLPVYKVRYTFVYITFAYAKHSFCKAVYIQMYILYRI